MAYAAWRSARPLQALPGHAGTTQGARRHVNLPAAALIGVLTVAMAPIGAALAHRLDGVVLKRAFGILLAVVAVRMLMKATGG